ncbi:YegP family protein [soil metagenome]
MNGYYQLKKSTAGKFTFNLKAGNHETILQSEVYESKASAQNGIASVQKNGPDEKRYDLKTSKNDQFYFVLKAGNGEVIGQSEQYTTEAARKNGVESVMANSPSEVIKEVDA